MTAKDKWKVLYPSSDNTLRLLSEDQVRVIYSDEYSSRYNSTVLKEISSYQSSLDASTIMSHSNFDERSYRLAGFDYDDNKLFLKIGLSRYLDYLAFRSNKKLLDKTRLSSEDLTSVLPNVVGNIGVLITRDKKTIAVVRSNTVSTYKGYLDFPGGHPEPVKDTTEEWNHGQEHIDLNMAINHELFCSVKREIAEDLSIDTTALGKPFLFSIILNLEDIMKPDMAFVLGTSLTAKDISDCFHSKKPQPNEVDKLLFFDLHAPINYFTGYLLTPIMAAALAVLDRNHFLTSREVTALDI